jgi:drug/metabolite transporter superfamily protein YnfA
MDTPVFGQLVVLTGITMVLFTLYMITDPQTSPSPLRSQIAFGSGIAIAYSILFDLHVQYTMFYAVTAVCAIRGCYLYWASMREAEPVPVAAAVGAGVASIQS